MKTLNGWNLVALADVAPTPWRNGGGSTRELLAGPDAQDWRWRFSVAEVEQAGPFSSFPGVQRWFAVLSGAGVRLRIGDDVHSLDATSPPFTFDGGAAVDCELAGGPTQDFNLMARGGSATLRRVSGEHAVTVNAMSLIAVYPVSIGATAVFFHQETAIPAQTLAWRLVQRDEPLQLTARDALWMEVRP